MNGAASRAEESWAGRPLRQLRKHKETWAAGRDVGHCSAAAWGTRASTAAPRPLTELMPSRLLLCGAAGQSPGNLEAGGDPAMVGVRGWGCRRTEGFVLTRDVRGKEGVSG